MQLQLQTVITLEHALNNLNIADKDFTTIIAVARMHITSHRTLSLYSRMKDVRFHLVTLLKRSSTGQNMNQNLLINK